MSYLKLLKFWQKKEDADVKRFQKNAGLLSDGNKPKNSKLFDELRQRMEADLRNLQHTGFDHVVELDDLPISRLSEEAKQKILQIAKDDLAAQFRTADEIAEKQVNQEENQKDAK